MAKKKVFISFDFDNDKVLKDFVIGQARLPDSPFEVEDWSMKEAAPERNWEVEAEMRIRRSDAILVIVGNYTHRAPGVLKEVALANYHSKKICQMIGYRDSSPTPVQNAGPLYSWEWNFLKNFLG